MERTDLKPAPPMIGVFGALARGFDRIAARPVLLLPPLALDAFLWLGPRVGLEGLFRQVAVQLTAALASDPSWAERANALRETLLQLGARFNLLSTISSFPVGIPSFMASSLPAASPLGVPFTWQVQGAGTILLVWLALTLVGLGLGTAFHRAIAAPLPASNAPAPLWRLWLRMVGLSAVIFGGLLIAGTMVVLLASLATLILPLLGIAVLFAGFSLGVWAGIYLVFTPHGMVRHHLGLVRAMRESVDMVRRNLIGTTGLVAILLGIDRLAGAVWLMPDPGTWYAGLAILGHAFVSAMILAASYAFYAGRREWWLSRRAPAVAPPAVGG